MVKKTAIIATCFAAAQLAGCATKHYTSSETPEQQKATIKATYSDAQITHGKTVYKTYCNKCHDYKPPADYSVKEWNKILPEMVRKAHLNSNEAGVVRAWIITNTKPS